MYQIATPVEEMVAGIISFKDLGSGPYYFSTKDNRNAMKKDSTITRDTLVPFQEQLIKLIQEIANPEIPFTAKDE
jgi:hypothetical protein